MLRKLYTEGFDGWTEHLVVPFVKRTINDEGSSGFFLLIRSIFYPDMFRHMVAILTMSECLITYSSNVLCYGRVRIMTRPVWPVVERQLATLDGTYSVYAQNTDTAWVALRHLRPPEDGNHLSKHVGVNSEYINKIHWLSDAFVGHLQRDCDEIW
jgi:hypothetical protein